MAEKKERKKIVDNVVKMDWYQGDALYAKGGKFGRVFVFASKEYETSVGSVTVFFNCHTAFIWADDANTPDEDRYNAKELKSWAKDYLDDAFPLAYSNYIPIVEFGASEVKQEVIEKYGLEEYVDDILARLNDVRPYAEERDSTY